MMKHFIRSAMMLSGLFVATTLFAADKVVVVPLAGVKGGVGETGQTKCYNATTGAVITCTGTGQDGAYQKGVSVSPRFVNNGNGTVTDKLTGLIWLRDGNCSIFWLIDDTGLNKRLWMPALSAANKLSSGFCGLTDGSVAGDWRLPNIKELLSLVDYGQLGPSLSSGHPFTNTQMQPSDYYWSSTSSVNYPDTAFVVRFYDGFGSTGMKSSGNYCVRAVRGGQ
jgi:hypothetical protein